MRQPGDLAYTHKRTDLANGFSVRCVELPLPMAGGRYRNVVFNRGKGYPPIDFTRHPTLEEALLIHRFVVQDYAGHPRVVTGPAKKGKVA